MTNAKHRVIPVPPPLPVMKNMSHGIHFFITLITGGLWAPMWIICTGSTNNQNKRAQRKYANEYAKYQQALEEYRA